MIIDKKALFSDIAIRARSPAGLGQLFGHLPNPDPILRARGQAIGVYRQLRAEPLAGSSIRRRKSAVKCLERGLEAGQAPAQVVRFIEQTLAQWDMNRLIGELLEAAFFGYQPAELTWVKDGRHLVVTDVVGKPPEWFTFDTDNRLRFQAQQSGLTGELLPPRKFVVATQDATFDNPYGFADLSLCFWPVTFKKAGWSFWMRFSEKYGTPWVVGRHPRSQDQAHITPLLHSLEQMVQDAVAVIPDDSSIEFKEPATKGASSSLYKDLIEMARSEITIALLGQNQTTEAETNHASAQAGLEVAADIRDGDAVMVMSAVNQILRWLVELNFGDVPVPTWRLWEQETIDEVQAKRDQSLAQTAGFFSAQYYQREYGLQPGDLLMESAPHATSSAAPPLTFAEDETKTASEAQAQLDRALDSLMKNGTLDNTLQPLLTPLFDAVKSGISPGELRGKLAALYPEMQADALQETLARVMFVANVWGGYMPRLHDNELAALFSLPPKRAIAYLKAKGFTFSWDWQDVWQDAHAQSATVAKVTRLDILQDIYQALDTSLAEGQTGQWFAKALTPVLQAKGWWGQQETTDPLSGEPVTVQLGSPQRLETIYRTNLTTLYNAGRWAEMRENVAARPYWMYVAIRDNRTRRSHLALHGRVFYADDPVWRALYPPNGWRCRCSVIALSARDVKARGLTVETSGDRLRWSLQRVSRKTGEMQSVAQLTLDPHTVFSPDIGWSYNPGEGYRPDLNHYQGPLHPLAVNTLGRPE